MDWIFLFFYLYEQRTARNNISTDKVAKCCNSAIRNTCVVNWRDNELLFLALNITRGNEQQITNIVYLPDTMRE